MTGGRGESPQSPYNFPGPAPPPTADSLIALASDVNLDKDLRMAALGGHLVRTGYNEGANAAKSEAKKSYPWWAILIYVSIVAISILIYFLPITTEDHKNQALGFLFGQATLITANFVKKGEKD